MKLNISRDLQFPLDTVTSTLVVYGGKGMGKTNLCAVVCEELYKNGLRFSLLDPLGVNWGLQYGRTKHGPGLKVLILGGIHGDVPIEPTGGAVVADLVVESDISVVIDISRRPDGQSWSMGERVRFVTDYCSRLYQRQGEKRRPIMQLIDEAGRFVPQQMPKGAIDIAKCVGAIEQMVEWGRNVGIGVCLITQRSARMNKSVSELADAMIAFRTVGPNSVDAVMDWLGEHIAKERIKEIVQELRSLQLGNAIVVSPGWLKVEKVIRVRMRETFDSSATPKAGIEPIAPGTATKPDLEAFKVRMAETIERVKSDDPKTLHLKILELERELCRKPILVAQEESVQNAQRERASAIEENNRLRADIQGMISHHDETGLAIKNLCEQIVSLSGRALDSVVVHHPPATFTIPNPRHHAQVFGIPVREDSSLPPHQLNLVPTDISRTLKVVNVGVPSEIGNSGLRRILIALAQYPQGRSAKQVGILARISSKSGTFSTYLGKGRSSGWIEGSNDFLKITDAGRKALGPYDRLPSGVDLQAHWMQQLGGGGAARMLATLIRFYPRAISKVVLGEGANISPDSGTFSTYLGKLRTLELIEGSSELKASPTLFER